MNWWYGHGLGKGGNIIDFAILYNNCTVAEFLHHLSGNLSFQKPLPKQLDEHAESDVESKIKILQEKALSSFSLLRYLHKRRLPNDLVELYCREVKYELNGKEYFGIGFKNNSGGYEIRNPIFQSKQLSKRHYNV